MRRLVVGLHLALLATVGLLHLEAHFRPMAYGRIYFQGWSSETMMQTVSIEDLKEEPLQSLWYLHIQPPAFDVMRAILAQIYAADDPMVMLQQVDRCIHVIWALVYGMTVFLVYWWLSDITGIAFAAVSALVFSAHPALIFYATLLETTLLSAFLILWFCYLLWRIKEGRSVPVGVLAGSFLALYFTRSVFQWHWLLLLPLCLVLLRLSRRKVLLFAAITSLVVGLYTVKQMVLFDIPSTSSFTGFNLHRAIGGGLGRLYIDETAPAEEASLASPHVLSRVYKVNGALNYNHPHYLDVNSRLQQEFRQQLFAASPRQLVAAMVHNLNIYLQPSSQYVPHLIVDHLPWRSAYDRYVSAPFLPLFLIWASLFWFFQTNKSEYARALGLALPVACIALISILFERGENMRFKFFIEPVLLCFLAAQAYAAGRELIRHVPTRLFKQTGDVSASDTASTE